MAAVIAAVALSAGCASTSTPGKSRRAPSAEAPVEHPPVRKVAAVDKPTGKKPAPPPTPVRVVGPAEEVPRDVSAMKRAIGLLAVGFADRDAAALAAIVSGPLVLTVTRDDATHEVRWEQGGGFADCLAARPAPRTCSFSLPREAMLVRPIEARCGADGCCAVTGPPRREVAGRAEITRACFGGSGGDLRVERLTIRLD